MISRHELDLEDQRAELLDAVRSHWQTKYTGKDAHQVHIASEDAALYKIAVRLRQVGSRPGLGWSPRNLEEKVWDYDLGGMTITDEYGTEGYDKDGNCIILGADFWSARRAVEKAAGPRPWMESEAAP